MEKILKLHSNEEAIALYGPLDENLRYAEREFRVRVSARNRKLKILGAKADVETAHRYFAGKLNEVREEKKPGMGRVVGRTVSSRVKHYEPKKGAIKFQYRSKLILPRSANQAAYLESIKEQDVVICIGPAGTGKTYLAMASAIDHLKRKQVSRIVLTRPAVEAGESLGFLPGDLLAKVDPYLRPLYDALYDMMDYVEATRLIERGVIEVAPLAYMRGRTLNDSFVILDEAQNCTSMQMKMFLTRLGETSKVVVTGDVTQIDLPGGKRSGLVDVQKILTGIEGIQFVYLTETDVVRHRLVQKIIVAYEKHDAKNSKA